MADFVTSVLNDVQDTWAAVLSHRGRPTSRRSWCSSATARSRTAATAQAAMGPFYCPADQKVYIDLGFYDELQERFGAPGDFAQAYVIAHEIGHHVQNLLGIDRQVRQRAGAAPAARPTSCPCGWSCRPTASPASGATWPQPRERRACLEPGDVEEALTAAAAIGDDRIQQTGAAPRSTRRPGRTARPTQRVQWFRVGMESGDPEKCDTFEGAL